MEAWKIEELQKYSQQNVVSDHPVNVFVHTFNNHLRKDGLPQYSRQVRTASGRPRLQSLRGGQSEEAVEAGNGGLGGLVFGEPFEEILDEDADAVGVPGAVVFEGVGAVLLLSMWLAKYFLENTGCPVIWSESWVRLILILGVPLSAQFTVWGGNFF